MAERLSLSAARIGRDALGRNGSHFALRIRQIVSVRALPTDGFALLCIGLSTRFHSDIVVWGSSSSSSKR